MRAVTAARGLGLALVLLAGCGGGDDEAGVGVGGQLPGITLPALTGEGAPLGLADLEGPAVVNLWATWCEPCRRELPAFQTASAAHPEVRFVGVDIGDDPAEALAFLNEIGVDTKVFEQYADADGELTDALGIANLPITVVLGDDGGITDVHVGPMTVDDLTAAIAEP